MNPLIRVRTEEPMTHPDPNPHTLTRQLQAAMIRPLIAIALNPETPPTTQNAAIQLATTYDNDLTIAALITAAQLHITNPDTPIQTLLQNWSLGRPEGN